MADEISNIRKTATAPTALDDRVGALIDSLEAKKPSASALVDVKTDANERANRFDDHALRRARGAPSGRVAKDLLKWMKKHCA